MFHEAVVFWILREFGLEACEDFLDMCDGHPYPSEEVFGDMAMAYILGLGGMPALEDMLMEVTQ